MSKLIDTTDVLIQRRRNYEFIDDGDDVTSGGRWTNLVAAGASIAASNVQGGVFALATGTTLNTPALRALTNSPMLPAKDQPIFFEARVKYTEANTNTANLFIGLSSAFPAETMQATTLGPLANFSGVGFYKNSGTLQLGVIVSVGTTQTLVPLTSLVTPDKQSKTTGAGAWQVFKIIIDNITATGAEVSFFIDTVLVQKIQWTWTSVVAMSAGCEIKTGSTTSETLSVDYVMGQQLRF